MIFAVEFDEVLARRVTKRVSPDFKASDWKLNPGPREALTSLRRYGQILIHTHLISSDHPDCDAEETKNRLALWLASHGYNWDYIWTGIGKPLADRYIEDADQLFSCLEDFLKEEKQAIKEITT